MSEPSAPFFSPSKGSTLPIPVHANYWYFRNWDAKYCLGKLSAPLQSLVPQLSPASNLAMLALSALERYTLH